MSIDLATVVVRMQADNSALVKSLEQTSAKLGKFSNDTSSMVRDIAGKFAAAFSIEKLTSFAASSIKSAASLDQLSQSAGITVEALSGLKLMGATAGLSTEDLGLAFKKLNVSISDAAGDPTNKAASAFRAMGISVTDSAGKLKTADVILNEMAGKFATYADGPNKVAIATLILGRNGDKLIPVLNKGSEALDAFRKAAEEAGLVTSGQTAKAAEELDQKLGVLKSTLVDGLSVQIAAKLLPVLNNLVTAFETGGGAGESMKVIADEIVVAFRLVATIVIETIAQVQKWGNAIGAVAAATVALAHGNLKEAKSIWADGAAANIAIEKKATDMVASLWHEQTAKEIADAKVAFDAKQALEKGKKQAPSIAGAAAGASALKELDKFRAGIQSQVLAFDLGGAALTRYRLQFGPLADAIKAAGAEGRKIAVDAQAWADALQVKVDLKATTAARDAMLEQIALLGKGELAAAEYRASNGELGLSFDRLTKAGIDARGSYLGVAAAQTALKDVSALTALSDATKALSGNTHDAALAAFDLQNMQLKADQTKLGNQAGLDTIAAQRLQVDAMSQINDLNTQANVIQSQLTDTVEGYNTQVDLGQLNHSEGLNKIAAAQTAALAQLEALYTAEKKIAETSGATNIALVEGVKKFGASLGALQTEIKAAEIQIRTGLESAFGNNFSDFITGAKSFTQAIRDMAKDIQKQFADMIAKNFAEKIFGTGGAAGGLAGFLAKLSGSSSGGGGSTAASLVGAFSQNGGAGGSIGNIVGSFAGGGTIPQGRFGMVGENGPELAYSGAQALHIVPQASAGKTIQMTNNFSTPTSNGVISRPSQMQQAAAVARVMSQANRRNNG